MKNKNIITIGGGTGSFVLLTGLKKYPLNISAIVSMADDGGSTGVLHDELGVLPPGDVRQCLVALSDSPGILRELINYRFEKGGFKGHSFGNLFLSALEKIKGDFATGVEEAAKILDIKGEVIPVSDGNMRLQIRLKDRTVLHGESHLDHNKKLRKIGVQEFFLKHKIRANKKALDRIKKADFIIIGPGDHFGSILPNLLVREISQAIKKSKAKVIYNCKLTNKKGQTDSFCLGHFVAEIEKYIGKDRIDFVTYNIAKPSAALIRKYERREGEGVLVGLDNGKQMGKYKIIKADLLNKTAINKVKNDSNAASRSFIRHDPEKLGKVIMSIIKHSKHENIH